jgi:hypothetical protein
VQDRLLELAKETIPVQSTNKNWKDDAAKVEKEFPQLIKPGKQFSKDGVSGVYDPNISVSLRVPSEKEMPEYTDAIAAYEPPAPDKISKVRGLAPPWTPAAAVLTLGRCRGTTTPSRRTSPPCASCPRSPGASRSRGPPARRCPTTCCWRSAA